MVTRIELAEDELTRVIGRLLWLLRLLEQPWLLCGCCGCSVATPGCSVAAPGCFARYALRAWRTMAANGCPEVPRATSWAWSSGDRRIITRCVSAISGP